MLIQRIYNSLTKQTNKNRQYDTFKIYGKYDQQS